MFYMNYYNELKLTHPFKEIRDYGYHVGTDYFSVRGKNQDFLNNIDGVLHDVGIGRDSGKYVTLIHNPGIIGKVKEYFYSKFKHMSKIEISLLDAYNIKDSQKFVAAGMVVGKFGNTGYCMTLDDKTKQYRFLTDEEKNDLNTLKGVHAHIEYYQPCEKGHRTKLMDAIDDFNNNEIMDFYVYQWGKVYYNPEVLYKYLEKN